MVVLIGVALLGVSIPSSGEMVFLATLIVIFLVVIPVSIPSSGEMVFLVSGCKAKEAWQVCFNPIEWGNGISRNEKKGMGLNHRNSFQSHRVGKWYF